MSELDIVYVIFARMSSSRFPKKVLKKLQGKTIIDGINDRLRLAGANSENIICATSNREDDDQLVDYCKRRNYPVFRGDLNNLCDRALHAVNEVGAKAFFRINADSPFINEELLIHAKELYLENQYEFVTNIPGRTWPYGVSVELISTNLLEKYIQNKMSEYEKEHLTSFFYKSLHDINHYIIRNKNKINISILKRLTIDEPGELERIERICNERDIVWYSDSYKSIFSKLNN